MKNHNIQTSENANQRDGKSLPPSARFASQQTSPSCHIEKFENRHLPLITSFLIFHQGEQAVDLLVFFFKETQEPLRDGADLVLRPQNSHGTIGSVCRTTVTVWVEKAHAFVCNTSNILQKPTFHVLRAQSIMKPLVALITKQARQLSE